MAGIPLTANRLRALLDYDPATGLFRWRSGTRRSGKLCLPRKNKYTFIYIDGTVHRASRLAFLWMTGAWPYPTVDHADGDTHNDRWLNLRVATMAQQGQNRKAKSNKKSRYKGLVWYAESQRWVARVNGKYCGSSKDEHQAYLMYCKEALKQFGKFARLA